ADEKKEALALLERAYEEVAHGFGFRVSVGANRPALHWTLSPASRLRLTETRWPGRGYDRAVASCKGGDRSLETARRCALGSSILRVAPATASWLRDGFAGELARQLGPAPRVTSEVGDSFAKP